MMFKLTDGKRTIALCLSIWDGKNYYDVTSWIMEMTVPYDEEKEARIVPDVQYCIDYATVDVGQIQQELERLYGQQAAQPDHRTEEGATQLLNELLKKPDRENPPPARTAAPHPSGPSSVSREAGDPLDGTDPFPRQSVRKELKQIREAQRTGQKRPRRRDPRNQSGHRPPQRSVRKAPKKER